MGSAELFGRQGRTAEHLILTKIVNMDHFCEIRYAYSSLLNNRVVGNNREQQKNRKKLIIVYLPNNRVHRKKFKTEKMVFKQLKEH